MLFLRYLGSSMKRPIVFCLFLAVIAIVAMFHGYQQFGENFRQVDKQKRTVLQEALSSLRDEVARLVGTNERRGNIVQTLKEANIKRLTSDTSAADQLYSKIRVLCWILTQPKNLETRAKHVRRTWGKRCKKLLFFSSVDNATFPTIGLGLKEEGRKYLTIKTIRPFRYVYRHFFNDYDWFLKADDDSYVIMENLLYFLSSQDTNKPIYFGHKFKTYLKSGYFSGGPGIVLSKEALRRLGHAGLDVCPEPVVAAGDLSLGRCMEKLNVTAGESIDSEGKNRFHCLNPLHHLMKFYPKWYYDYDAHGAKWGMDSMSDYAIGFHYVNADMMYLLEYALYHLRPYGIHVADKELNRKDA